RIDLQLRQLQRDEEVRDVFVDRGAPACQRVDDDHLLAGSDEDVARREVAVTQSERERLRQSRFGEGPESCAEILDPLAVNVPGGQEIRELGNRSRKGFARLMAVARMR